MSKQAKKKKSHRPTYPMVDISDLDQESQLSVLKALAKEEQKQK